jgi:hypothetical protein
MIRVFWMSSVSRKGEKMPVDSVKRFIRDCALAIIASYVGVLAYQGFSTLSFRLAWWVISEGMVRSRLAFAVFACVAGSIAAGILIRRYFITPDAVYAVSVMISVLAATIIAGLIGQIIALPYLEDDCYGVDRRTVSFSVLVFLQPIAIVTILTAEKNAGRLLSSMNAYFRKESDQD